MENQESELFRIFHSVIPAFSGLLGVFVGYWLTIRRERLSRKLDFIEKQLCDFYSPMVGFFSDIFALNELEKKISECADDTWRELAKENLQSNDYGERQTRHNERWKKFKPIIDYNNQQTYEKLVPFYRKMLELFREKLYLADQDTRDYYSNLVEFVNIWDRCQANSLPPEVTEKLNHGNQIVAFKKHLEQRYNKLRVKLQEAKTG